MNRECARFARSIIIQDSAIQLHGAAVHIACTLYIPLRNYKVLLHNKTPPPSPPAINVKDMYCLYNK